MQAVEEIIDRSSIGRRVVLEDVLVGHRPQSPHKALGIEQPRVARARQRPSGARKHQFVNLFRDQAQGSFSSKTVHYAITLQSGNRGQFRQLPVGWMSQWGERLHAKCQNLERARPLECAGKASAATALWLKQSLADPDGAKERG